MITNIGQGRTRSQLLGDINQPYREMLRYISVDRLTIWLIWAHFITLLILVGWKPLDLHTKISVLSLALLASLITSLVKGKFPNHYHWRVLVVLCLALYSALFIFVSGGAIETHFHFFIVMAYLIIYSDWRLQWISALLATSYSALANRLHPEWIPTTHPTFFIYSHLLPILVTAILTSIVCTYYRNRAVELEAARSAMESELVERKRIEEQIYSLAFFDQLTGLPNGTLLTDRMEHMIARARQSKTQLAVLFLDIDRFKTINDSLGHKYGNLLLKEVGKRLSTIIDPSGIVSRQGGDEFTIIQGDVLKKEEVESLAKRIMQDISKPYHIKAQEIHITSSLGISIFPTDSDQSDYLTVQADAAMYGAKNQARNTYQFYNPELHANALERLDLENDLRHALEHGELQVYYQPLYNLLSKQIIGMEALLRWNHPKLGMISPSKFITAAEESGIIVPLGEWVLRESCLQLRRWQQEGLTHSIYVSVNVSIQQLDEDFIQTVESILAEVGLEAKYLELEITESSVLPDDKIVITLLEKLHQMGIGLCIDDFGTGYSALSRIGKLPISTLKIDRSFITPITEERSNFSIVRAIVNIAHTLRLKVIAEGVESDIQAEFLESLGCDCIQGYLISPPVPASEFKRLIE